MLFVFKAQQVAHSSVVTLAGKLPLLLMPLKPYVHVGRAEDGQQGKQDQLFMDSSLAVISL
jgi:hypothetical protein